MGGSNKTRRQIEKLNSYRKKNKREIHGDPKRAQNITAELHRDRKIGRLMVKVKMWRTKQNVDAQRETKWKDGRQKMQLSLLQQLDRKVENVEETGRLNSQV